MIQEPYISAENLAAMRGERVLYRAQSLRVQAGEVVLLRGKNGAGKTTFLRQLAGLSQPDSGTIVRTVPHHWLGHATGLKDHETPRRHLQHWAKVWGARADLQAILTQMGLKRPADVPVRLLSAGQKRRTALARLAVSERKLWLVDEPFTALDVDGQAVVSEMMQNHLMAGGALVAAVHADFPIPAKTELCL